MEEIKRKIAAWMGIEVREGPCGKDIIKPKEHIEYFSSWTPELGGEDLSEVLAKLNHEERIKLYYTLDDICLPNDDRIGFLEAGLMGELFWFQNPDNAKTILKAVAAVI